MRNEIAQLIVQDRVMELVYGNNSNPKQMLGRHMIGEGQVICAYHPDAVKVCLIDESGQYYDMDPIERLPLYAIYFPHTRQFSYKIIMTFVDGNTFVSKDPYSFPCQITKEEEQLFLSGKWVNAYEKLGAHSMVIDGVPGVYFAVWAPNARRVSVVGDFNYWNGMIYPMERLNDSGIFELFIPGITEKALYKFEIKTKDGGTYQKVDPFGTVDLNGKGDTSIVLDMEKFQWNDQKWMQERRFMEWKSTPFAVCDREFLDQFAEEFKESECFTHVLLKTPVFCHGVSGNIKKWINDLHNRGIGVIMELSLGLFGKNDIELVHYDGTDLYGYDDPKLRLNEEKDMYRFNHSKKEVVSYLLSYLVFWIREYHVDGFLFEGMSDMVRPVCATITKDTKKAETIYQKAAEDFIYQAVKVVKDEDFSVLVFADEKEEYELHNDDLMYSKAPFDALVNYGITRNLGEYLLSAVKDPSKDFHKVGLPLMKNGIRKTIMNVSVAQSVHFNETFLNEAFINAYDHLSWKKLTMGYLMGVPGKKRWSWQEMESAPIHNYMKQVFQLYMGHKCMYCREPRKSSFVWINGLDAKNAVLTFLRRSPGEGKSLMFVYNFSRERKEGFRVGVPKLGDYRMLLNSDWEEFGGSVRNHEENVMHAIKKEWDLQPYSIRLTIPALSVLVFEFK